MPLTTTYVYTDSATVPVVDITYSDTTTSSTTHDRLLGTITNDGAGTDASVISKSVAHLDLGGRVLQNEVDYIEGDSYTTDYHYNAAGLQYMTDYADGTTSRTEFDAFGRATKSLMGVGTPVEIESYVYDDTDGDGVGDVGDGNVSQTTVHPSSSGGRVDSRP